ncbi:MAG TPA: EAL domain-containing protein [Arenibaculum sp.]|nr:EAL domain-containing protein [Arenibaculum sp.]
MIRKSVAAGSIIFREGEPADCAYIVARGRVEASVQQPGQQPGRHAVLASFGAGEIFGEMGVIDDHHRTATTTAVENTDLLVIGRPQLERRLAEAEPVLRLLLNSMLSRFRTIQGGIVEGRFPTQTRREKGDAGTARAAFEFLVAEQEFERALAAGEFEPFLQPIVRLETGELAGFEALVRWRHPERGLVPPGEFIPLAERSGLVRNLDLQVLRSASRTLARILEASRLPLFLSVNLSGVHLADMAIIEHLRDALAASGLDAASLKIEVTESALVQDPETAHTVLARVRDLGVRIALDDFGTGYSSLAYLHRFPIDVLKIDQSFVRSLNTSQRTRNIVSSIAGLAHSLNMDLVAEGVETADLVQPLLDLGCTYGQGYLFGRPAPAADAERLVLPNATELT